MTGRPLERGRHLRDGRKPATRSLHRRSVTGGRGIPISVPDVVSGPSAVWCAKLLAIQMFNSAGYLSSGGSERQQTVLLPGLSDPVATASAPPGAAVGG